MSGLFGGNKMETSAPIISSLKLQTSCYGRAKPWVFGTTRVTPNVIDYVDFTATAHKTEQQAGKGGGGGQSTTEYTYSVATIMALCSGPIEGIDRVWADKDISTLPGLRLDLYVGDTTQTPWPYMASRHPERALSYRDLAYVASGNFDLGETASFSNHSMEVRARNSIAAKYPGSAIPDAEVADVITAILTDPDQGIGLEAGSVDGIAKFREFCLASGVWVSPAYTEQKPAGEYLRSLLDIGFSDCVYSGGIFKIVPYSDVKVFNGLAVYTPTIAPVYALTVDDFIPVSSDDTIQVVRKDQDERYNHVTVKFSDRGNSYNDSIATSEDQADIENTGLRPKDVIEYPEIADSAVAQKVADFHKHRSLYVANEYTFKLPWKYILLEPMDVVTLTLASQFLDGAPVLIIDIDEDDETGELTIRAEDYPLGTNAPSLQAPPTVDGNIPNFAIEPGNATVPVLFEAPLQLTLNRPQIWLATAGGVDWGGCDVWVSTDNASFQRMGRVQAPARYGSMSEPLGLGASVDTLNVASVDLSASRGVLLGGTEDNARDLITICYVDGEYLAYAYAALTGVNTYRLSYLVRGAYGTDIAEHAVGKSFVRLDDAIFKYDYPKEWLGKTIWIKLVSYNKYGGGLQEPSKVPAYRYVIEGAPLGAVQNVRLATEWIGKDGRIAWDLLDGADSYDVQVQAGAPVTERRLTVAVKGNEYFYAADDMTADGGPWREIVFRVRGRAVTGKTGPWSQILATNEQVGALEGIRVDVGYQSIVFKCARPVAADYAGLLVWVSKDAAFVPTVANADFDGPGTMAFLGEAQGETLVQGGTYYIHAAGYDDFGKDLLTISPSIVVVIPHNVASEVADGVIKESNLSAELGSKIDYVSDLADKFPEAVVAQLVAQQHNAAGDKDALASTQLLAMAQGDRDNRVISQQVTTVKTTVGQNTASVQQIMRSIDGTSANLFMKASVNGRVAGMAIGVDGDQSEVVFLGQRFFVAKDDAADTQAVFTIITEPTEIAGVPVEPGMYVNAAFINAATIAQAIIGQAIIDGANIKDAAIGSAHIRDAVITMAKISETLESENYVVNTAGWKIWKNGQAEFNGVTIRGDIKGGSINIRDKFIVDADGTVTIKSALTGARTVESAGLKLVYDNNNVLRMREGVW